MRRLALVLLVACGGAKASSRDPTELQPAVVRPVPLTVEPGAPSAERDHGVEVALADGKICVRVEGKAYCGSDDERQPLASGEPIVDDAVSIATTRDTFCAVRQSGQVTCRGDNRSGFLGAGLAADRSDAPVAVSGVKNARRVVVSSAHACAVGAGLACWGRNATGATGGTAWYSEDARELALPVAVAVPSPIAVAVTFDATCALTTQREVWCWGTSRLAAQQVAQGGQNEKPWHAAELDGLEDLAGGENVFCGVREGAVTCWGSSFTLFPDFRGDAKDPRPIELPAVKRVRVASSHACALTLDGRVLCWGSAASGALGRDLGDDSDNKPPEVVAGLPRVVDIAVGGFMSCAVVDGGDVYCWGRWPWRREGPPRVEPTPVKLHIRD